MKSFARTLGATCASGAVASALILAAPGAAWSQGPARPWPAGGGFVSPTAKQYVAQAEKAAGSDLRGDFESMCRKPTPPTPRAPPPPGSVADTAPDGFPVRKMFEPTRVFDNLYFVASSLVGASAITTSDGIILIDTMLTSEDAAQIPLGLKKLGVDPAKIKYVIITHSHGDHYGGAKYLRETYPGFKIVMSKEDWDVVSRPAPDRPNGQPDPSPLPPHAASDISYTGTYAVTLGDTTVTLIETPGHTVGTSSLIFPVKAGGKTYNLMQWGGGGPMDARVSLASVETFVAAAKKAKVAGRWGSHASSDWAATSAKIRAGGPNPILQGEAKMSRYLDVLLACKHAVLAEGTS